MHRSYRVIEPAVIVDGGERGYFGKPLINCGIYILFISGFLKPFYVLEIGFQNSFLTTAAAFQQGFLAN
jgi:hypothetical protein